MQILHICLQLGVFSVSGLVMCAASGTAGFSPGDGGVAQVARTTIAIAEFVGMTERAHLTKRGISRLHHSSARMPLKNGCRTFLSSDDLGLLVQDCRQRSAKTAMKANKPIHRFRFDGWTMEAGSLRSHSSGHLFDSSTSEEHLYFRGDQCRTLGMPQNRL